ncbi:MAG: serine/threonine protein kinase [Polyangiaceae bacterium]|nr:serine/threonine protein kinase [Polyangiaceae bacterium]
MAKQQQYRVLERIASGGMAEVFRAESAGLEGFKKKVAIKRVLPHLCEKKEFIGMFLDEARLSAHLGHSNCVQVFDIGRGDDSFFIVMELVDGADLKGVMEHRRKVGQAVPVAEACLICAKICEGLAYAHELVDEDGQSLHIVHRDMSPPNVLITRYGEVKIVDFGLAKANSQLEESQPGIIKGKFGYLSPEAAQGQAVDQRTDIFAVGIILWEMLAGQRLFQGKTDLEKVKKVQRAEVPDIRQLNPQVSDGVWSVMARALAGDPNQRYQTARALGEDLTQVLFSQAQPVTSFDIARLVLDVQQARASEKQASQVPSSLIGSLIQEALLEFTSLGEGGDSNGPDSHSQGSVPLALGSFSSSAAPPVARDEMDWEDSLSWGTEAEAPPPSGLGDELELGNLSALEDDAPETVAPKENSAWWKWKK